MQTISADTKQIIQQNLISWYDQNKRDLPWRKTKNPYFIWISEIMLQQTRVEAVKEYYIQCNTALPTVEDLANVPEDKLLKLWQGLGYYSRAKNLKIAAQAIVNQFGGKFPNTKQQLLTLKGVGEYTANAISSIAFEQANAVVDGNVLRVYSRLFELYEDIAKPQTLKNVNALAQTLLPQKRVGDYNQAIMELGATVCVPNQSPMCNKCPFRDICKANQKSLQSVLPVKSAKPARTIEQKTIFIIENSNSYLLLKRQEKGLLSGLWEFLNTDGHLTLQQATQYLQTMGLLVKTITPSVNAKHIFTHKEWHMVSYKVVVLNKPNLPQAQWLTAAQINNAYSVPTAFLPFLKQIS